MASNATWIAENTELNEALLFGVRRVGQDNWESNLPWATISDFISTLTAANAAAVPSLSRGSVYQVSKVSAGSRVKVDIQWLGTQSSGSFFTAFGDELPDLISVLTSAASETDEPIDLDGDKPWQVRQQDLPAYLQPEALTNTFGTFPASFLDPSALTDASTVTALTAGEFVSSFGNSPARIEGGTIEHTPTGSANSAAYIQSVLPSTVGRIGCVAEWDADATGSIALVIPEEAWTNETILNAGVHVVVSADGAVSSSRFQSGLVNVATGNAGSLADGSHVIEVTLDPRHHEIAVHIDGALVVTHSDVGAFDLISEYAIWELFEEFGSSDIPARLLSTWADVPRLVPARGIVTAPASSPSASSPSGAATEYGAAGTYTATTTSQNTTHSDLSTTGVLFPPSGKVIVTISGWMDGPTAGRVYAMVNNNGAKPVVPAGWVGPFTWVGIVWGTPGSGAYLSPTFFTISGESVVRVGGEYGAFVVAASPV